MDDMFSAEELNEVQERRRFELPDNNLFLKIIKLDPGTSKNGDKQLQVLYQCTTPGLSLDCEIEVYYYNTVKANWKMKNLAKAAGFCDEDGKILADFRWRDLLNKEILGDISTKKDSEWLDVTNERPVPADTPPEEAKPNPNPLPTDGVPIGELPESEMPF